MIRFLLFCLFLSFSYSINVNLNDEHDEIHGINRYKDVEFYIAVRQNSKGVQKLENLILNEISSIYSPNYGRYLSIREIDEYVRSDPEDIEMVRQWLESHGIYNCVYYSDSIKCVASYYRINGLLNVHMTPKMINGRIRFHSSEPYEIPERFEGVIEFIDGISNRIESKIKQKTHYPQSGMVTREVIMRLYNIDDTVTHGTVSVGAMAYGPDAGFRPSDLAISQIANGGPNNTINQEHLVGINSKPPDGESQLDVQTMCWAAQDAELWYYHVDGWMFSWANGFYNREDVPEVASMSYGWSEYNQCAITTCVNETSKTYVQRCNREFMKIAARGKTLLASSGDAGSPGRTNEGCNMTNPEHLRPVFPASSPWILAVGATYVTGNNNTQYRYRTPACTNVTGYHCARGELEAGTSYNMTGWTSGSGFSAWEGTPVWQRDEVWSYIMDHPIPKSEYYNQLGRGYPDVAVTGHNCLIHDEYWQGADGTSCSSPVMAGIIANFNAYQKSKGRPVVGFVNPLLYTMYNKDPLTFSDLLFGDSAGSEFQYCGPEFGFRASFGWDPVGGLGSPNVRRIKSFLDYVFAEKV